MLFRSCGSSTGMETSTISTGTTPSVSPEHRLGRGGTGDRTANQDGTEAGLKSATRRLQAGCLYGRGARQSLARERQLCVDACISADEHIAVGILSVIRHTELGYGAIGRTINVNLQLNRRLNCKCARWYKPSPARAAAS